MSGDIYFRTSLTGYNKQDVLKFIEKLNCEQTERMNELNDHNRILQNELKKIRDELSEFKNKCESLEKANAEIEENYKISSEKASKYDDMQSKYASLMLNAEHEAQIKIASAESEAKKIINSAQEEIDRRKRELDEMRDEFKDTFVENRQIIEHSKEELTDVFEKICSSIDTIYGKVSGACTKYN